MEQNFLFKEKIKILYSIGALSLNLIGKELSVPYFPFGVILPEYRKIQKDYQTLFQQLLDGFALHEIIYDSNGTPVDYRFLAINPAFQKLTGLGPEIIGKTVLEVMPETEKYWIEFYGEVALTGKPKQFKNISKTLNKYFEVSAFSASPNQFACIFVDISERKQLEEKLRHAEKMEAIGTSRRRDCSRF